MTSSTISLNLSTFEAELVLAALRSAEEAAEWSCSLRVLLADDLEGAVSAAKKAAAEAKAAADLAAAPDWERALLSA